ncbi:MAG: methylenetetrahydrofolate reductase C-terminal domain-containing protein [Lentisphaeria bacterium]|nr:methylenetetrahydrofolate reductase C-terminal domain-containing protein [Lentisphaeria bacterium]
MNETQLEINLDPVSGNRFRQALESGRFVTLIETQVPAAEMDKEAGIRRLEMLENAIFSGPLENVSLAITDNPGRPDWKAVEYASGLPAANRDRHVVYLSGANLSKEAVLEQIQMAENANLYNIIPVSGDIPEKCRTLKECRKTVFTESVSTLNMLKTRSSDFFTGATVNPFQYTPYALLGSYYKLMKKFNSGAGFLVTQAGWDMLKLQSLAWYLTGRDMYYPKIARLTLLSPEKTESIISGNTLGIKMSKGMKKLLETELTYNRAQFDAVQYRRLELQVSGCRLLGFSGVQICGADNPSKMDFILKLIRSALNEFTSFDVWLEKYNAFMASTEMAPFEHNFHLFDRILHRPYPFDAPPETREIPPADPALPEKIGYGIRSFLFRHADRQRAANAGHLKTLLTGCRGCDTCYLPQKSYICPLTCPLGLVNGICGSVDLDGSCPVSKQECIHHRILRMAHWRKRLHEQENMITDGK